MTQIQIDNNDLRKLSREFRSAASRLLRTDFNDSDGNLRRFMAFIDRNEIIRGFVEQKLATVNQEDINLEQSDFDYRWNIPDDPDQEVAWVYHLLKEAASPDTKLTYMNISFHYDRGSNKIQDHVDAFNRSVVQPFVDHILTYLDGLMIDAGLHDGKATFSITNTGTYIVGNVQGSNVASGEATISDSTATYTDARSLVEGVNGLRQFMEDVPNDQKQEAEEAIDVLVTSASGGSVPKTELARKVEFLGNLNDNFKKHLIGIAVGTSGGVASHGIVAAITYVFDLLPK